MCSLSRATQSSSPDIEESRAKGALLFVTLKKLNRLSHLYCKEARDKTQAVSNDDDIIVKLINKFRVSKSLMDYISSCKILNMR